LRLARTVLRQTRVRARLVSAVLVGAARVALLPPAVSGPTRTLVAWDAGVGLYLVLAWIMMVRSDVQRMRRRAERQDDGAAVVLALSVAAAIASLAAIVLELIGVKSDSPRLQTLHLALSGSPFCAPGFSFTPLSHYIKHTNFTKRPKDDNRP